MPQNTSLNPRPKSHINSAYLKLFKKIEINLKSKTIHSTVYLKLQVFYFYSTFWQIWGDIYSTHMHFTRYVIITYAFGSVHEKVGVWIKAIPKSIQGQNSWLG